MTMFVSKEWKANKFYRKDAVDVEYTVLDVNFWK